MDEHTHPPAEGAEELRPNDVRRMDMETLVSYLWRNAARWMRQQRDRHWDDAEPLPDITRAALKGYFEPETLARTRIRRVPIIENPAFYTAFDEAGETIPLDFRVWAAITFGDLILLSDAQVPGPPPHSVIFHEMVHVVQFGALGIDAFAEKYVRGLAQNRFNYMAIPLETVAFDLQGRFEASAGRRFAAESEVLAELDPEDPPGERGGESLNRRR
ncbi:MAG: hypothetical protein D6701_04295 [Gemmatimonadetes bacterium]|nr:MAG: hypothetical protein D6701_04295 [Gemmatimonadota bacterium]